MCQYEKDQVSYAIREINVKIQGLTNILKNLHEKENQLKEKKSELEKLIKSLPELPAEDKKGQEELSKLMESKKIFESKIIEFQSVLTKISEIESKVKIFKGKISEFKQDIGALLAGADILESGAFEISINETRIKNILDNKEFFGTVIKNQYVRNIS